MEETDLSQEERREQQRRRVIKGGVILRGISESEIQVTIVNLTDKGARIRIEPETAIPEEFLLYIRQNNSCYRCELRWRKEDLAGLEFIERTEKPKWHLG